MHAAPAPDTTLMWLRRGLPWGLRAPGPHEPRAQRRARAWLGPRLLALLATIPAFYGELLDATPAWLPALGYGMAAGVTLAALAHVAAGCRQPMQHLRGNPVELALAAGLLLAAALPGGLTEPAALALRGGVAALTLWRLVWTLRPLLVRGGVAYLLALAAALLVLSGAGFWWLEPSVHGLDDGLWLAFTTAATVGYGDLLPTTPAARIFAVFVVLLGYGVLSLVTAAIAARWVETGERRMEQDILRDLHREMGLLRAELAALREQVTRQAPPRD